MHVEHFQPAAADGGFIPAAAQLNPLTGAAGGIGALACADETLDAPGFGASQTWHLVNAVDGLLNPQSAQSHVSAGLVGTFKPAAAQSNPPVVGLDEDVELDPGAREDEEEKSYEGRE